MILAQAPSNIALVKYMGKADSHLNLPVNSSLSMTLDSLCSYAEVEKTRDEKFEWITGLPTRLGSAAHCPILSEKGRMKVNAHIVRVSEAVLRHTFPQFGIRPSVCLGMRLRTANTFPEQSGIASSASSFAAITLAVAAALAEDRGQFNQVYSTHLGLRRELARLSRQGSGSSCRSFEGPWVLWQGPDAARIEALAMPQMSDLVLLVSAQPKRVSSSEAHARVQTSPLWDGRAERAEDRASMIENALAEADLDLIARVVWSEMWEMHSLFHTCAQPFTYWEPNTIGVLNWLAPWVGEKGAPIVTLDAGPNVHIVVPSVQAPEWEDRIAAAFPSLQILRDTQGAGARLV